MARYRLTARRGATVDRSRFDDLEAALAALRAGVEEALAEGPLPAVKALRDFEPAQRVAARFEVSTGGWLRGEAAGIDVMGDGEQIAFAGGVRRRPLEPEPGEEPAEAVRRALLARR